MEVERNAGGGGRIVDRETDTDRQTQTDREGCWWMRGLGGKL